MSNSQSAEEKRQLLIQMVDEVKSASACMVDFDSMLGRLESKIGDPRISELIFDPPGGTPLTAEQIVDMSLSRRQT